jgi:hypothetical protein
MIEGTRKVVSAETEYEIVFGLTGDRFMVQHIIAADRDKLDSIPKEEVEMAIKETEEILSTWDPNHSEEYENYLLEKGVEIFHEG